MSEQDSNSGARPAEPDQRRSPLRVDVAWLGAAGVALYVMLRIPFAIFYDKFGTSPEEVGLG